MNTHVRNLAIAMSAVLLAVSMHDLCARNLNYFKPYLFPEWGSERDEQYVYLVAQCPAQRQGFGTPVLKRGMSTMTENYSHVLEVHHDIGIACFRGERAQLFAIRLPPEVRQPSANLATRMLIHAAGSPDGTVRTYDTDASWSGYYFEPDYGASTARSIPPSVGGTWYAPAFPTQGLLLTLSRPGLVVSWNTYDAQGAPIWLTGLTTPIASPNYTNRGQLFSTRGGVFAGAPATPPAQPAWGEIEIEYLACGRLRVKWQPIDTQAYRSGETEMHQLTSMGAHGGCSIQELAGSAYELTIVDPILQLD